MLKATIKRLYEAIHTEEDEDLREIFEEAVKDSLATCNEYVKLVAQQEQLIQLARFRLEGNDYREYVEELDRSRRFTHDGLVVKVDLLNRTAARFKLEPIADVCKSDRETYAAFALKVVTDYFEESVAA